LAPFGTVEPNVVLSKLWKLVPDRPVAEKAEPRLSIKSTTLDPPTPTWAALPKSMSASDPVCELGVKASKRSLLAARLTWETRRALAATKAAVANLFMLLVFGCVRLAT